MLQFLKPRGPFRITNLEVIPKTEQVSSTTTTTSDIARTYEQLRPFILDGDEKTSLALVSNGEIIRRPFDPEYVTTRLEVSLLTPNEEVRGDEESTTSRRASLVSYNPLISLNDPTMQYEVLCHLDSNSNQLRITHIAPVTNSRFETFEGFFKRRGFTIETILSEASPILSRRDTLRETQIKKLVERFELAFENLKEIIPVQYQQHSNFKAMPLAEIVYLKRQEREGDYMALNFLKALYRRYPLHFARYK